MYDRRLHVGQINTSYMYYTFYVSYIFFNSLYVHVGKFLIKGVKANEEGESTKVKVKVRLNIHGIFFIKSATLYMKQVHVLHCYVSYL